MEIKFIDRISQITDQQWQQLDKGNNNPFTNKAFLQALEDSGAASKQGGWQPHHLIIKDKNPINI